MIYHNIPAVCYSSPIYAWIFKTDFDMIFLKDRVIQEECFYV
jgi:hypothetical protein